MASVSICIRQLTEEFIRCGRKSERLMKFLRNKFPSYEEDKLQKILGQIKKRYVSVFNSKWKQCHRKKSVLFHTHSAWLDKTFIVQMHDEEMPGPSNKRSLSAGRPMKPFHECSERAKRYKVQQLRDSYSEEQLKVAAGKTSAKKGYMDPQKALAMVMDAQLSKHQYDVIRSVLKDFDCDVLPPYYKVREEKEKCYPENITITPVSAQVDLQSLLDHTAKRILAIENLTNVEYIPEVLTLTSKWGCDGSSNQSQYHQTLPDEFDGVSDANLFMVSMVPLVLETTDHIHIWKNLRPSSPKFCRPIQFEYAKETSNKTKELVESMQRTIKSLLPTSVNIKDKLIEVRHNLLFTMMDTKVAQAASGCKASAVCYICKARPQEMNNLNLVIKKPCSQEALRMGISPLHARIKSMEFVLHLGYNLTFQRWSTNAETKPQKEANKSRIQKELRERLGIRVDYVQQGFGTTNTGNTSRRFFHNPEIVSEVTGVDLELIKRLATILEVITCGESVDSTKYGKYALDTARRFVELYNWYFMPVTIHKILIHGESIISSSFLPIGYLSEEAQEARNKDYRNYRLRYTRKCSRTATNEDILKRLLVSSDPFLANIRVKTVKKHMDLSEEAKQLLFDDLKIQ